MKSDRLAKYPTTEPATAGKPSSADTGDITPRQREIVRRIVDRGFATIDALASDFAVSAQTIRREVMRLSDAGLLQRFHGGAGLFDNSVRLDHSQKLNIAAEGKRRIAEATIALLPKRASVFLDVGTTVEMVADAMSASQGFRVFTPSMPVAMRVAGHGDIEVFVTGGTVGGRDGSLIGSATISAIGMFRVDIAVIGCSAFDEDGAPMDFDLDKVAAKQAMIANARRTFVVADASKFDRTAIVRIAEPGAIERIITDQHPNAAFSRAFDQAGIKTVIA